MHATCNGWKKIAHGAIALMLLTAALDSGETAKEGEKKPKAEPGITEGDNSGIDTSAVKPPDCRTCSNTGFVLCNACDSAGRTLKAKIECKRCGGKGVLPCGKCDKDGKVDCEDCKKMTVEGEEGFYMVSPEWKEWNKKYGLEASRTFSKNSRLPPAPKKYVICTTCNGEGRINCPICDGSRAIKCKTCNGTGKVEGLGPCPICLGTKHLPCPSCAMVEGAEELPGLKNLDELRANKTISEAEYFKQRRLLVAQEKYRRQVLAERAKGEKALSESGGKTADSEKSAAEQRKALESLLEAFGAKAIDAEMYEGKLRLLGLEPNMIREIESAAAANNARIKALNELKEAFRSGKFDYTEYRERIKSI